MRGPGIGNWPIDSKRQHAAQARALNCMGIEHRIRADGTVLVLRAHVEAPLGLKASKNAPSPPEFRPIT